MHVPKAYDPRAAVLVSRRNLPHYRQDGAIYYITMRLADSLPAMKLRQWQGQMQDVAADERTTFVARRMERWLDRGEGKCLLEKPGAAEFVEKSLRDRDGIHYLLDEYVVMPNHVHALVMPLEGNELSDIAHAWKAYTAHEINKLLCRKGGLWQLEPFDHIVRDVGALGRFRKYIRDNPLKQPGRRCILGAGSFATKTRL